MSNEIVSFKSDTGVDVQITAQDVRNIICPQANEKEIAYFLELCRAQRLNPWVKDAYLVKYGNGPASIITGKETFTKRANANKAYKGFEAGVVYIDRNGNVCQREGSAVYKKAGEQLVGGWCRVYVEGRKPFYDEVTLDEYSTGKSNWVKMPATMIRKVALVHCLREAFPDDFQGLYAAEEMGNAGEQAAKLEDSDYLESVEPNTGEIMGMNQQQRGRAAQAVMEAEFVEVASDEQLDSFDRNVIAFANMRGKAPEDVVQAVFNSRTMRELGAEGMASLTAEQAGAAIGLLQHWIDAAAQQEREQQQAADDQMQAEYEVGA